MATRLAGITIDCADPARLASFWSALLDITVTGEHSDAGWATVDLCRTRSTRHEWKSLVISPRQIYRGRGWPTWR